MKMHLINRDSSKDFFVGYWWDHYVRCWWTAKFRDGVGQIGDAENAYTKPEIIKIAESLYAEK